MCNATPRPRICRRNKASRSSTPPAQAGQYFWRQSRSPKRISDAARQGCSYNHLVMSTVRHIDPVCHAFDAAWKAGQRPKIEEYLPDASPSVRSQLFRKLLQIDLAYRVSHNEKPTLEEYRLRFPEEGDLIRDAFRDVSTAADIPHSGPLPTLSFAADHAGEPAADWPAIPGHERLGQLAPGGMGVVYR